MADFSSDQDQIEQLKTWWKQYGKVLLIAIVIGLACGYGWRYWQARRLANAETASLIYQELLVAEASGSVAQSAPLARQIIQNYASTPYADLASFLEAKRAVDNNQLFAAVTSLNWVIQHSSIKAFKQIAYLRKARVLLAQKHYKKAFNTLDLVKDISFKPAANVIRGDLYVAQGYLIKAHQAYLAAQKEYQQLGIDNQIVKLKLARYASLSENGENHVER